MTNQSAIFDQSGRYRYSLWREWDWQTPKVGFVMLNPSRADSLVDDPTIRRCIGFAHTWGFGGLEVVNLFAYRTTNPVELGRVADPVGGENNFYLISLQKRVEQIVLAWGNGGSLQGRDRTALTLLSEQSLYCLGLTQTGQPRHPLYLRRDTLPVPFTVQKFSKS